MNIKEAIEDFNFEEFLNEEKFSDEKIRGAVNKIEKDVEVGKNGRYSKIGKIGGEKYSPAVQGSKKSYNELADKATMIRKGLLLGAYIGRSPSEKKENIPHKLNQLRNFVKKMKFHKKIVNKAASGEAATKAHESAVAKLRAPVAKRVAKEEWREKEAKRQVKGAKAEKRADWEKRVKDLSRKKSSQADW